MGRNLLFNGVNSIHCHDLCTVDGDSAVTFV
jgi:hypothetical protein